MQGWLQGEGKLCRLMHTISDRRSPTVWEALASPNSRLRVARVYESMHKLNTGKMASIFVKMLVELEFESLILKSLYLSPLH